MSQESSEKEPVEEGVAEADNGGTPAAVNESAEYVSFTRPSSEVASGETEEGKKLMTRKQLSRSAEEMISDMNAKRRRDTALLKDFKTDLDTHCSQAFQTVEAAVYRMYQKKGSEIDTKLQELSATLERIDKLEAEMEQFRKQLGAFCTDVQP